MSGAVPPQFRVLAWCEQGNFIFTSTHKTVNLHVFWSVRPNQCWYIRCKFVTTAIPRLQEILTFISLSIMYSWYSIVKYCTV